MAKSLRKRLTKKSFLIKHTTIFITLIAIFLLTFVLALMPYKNNVLGDATNQDQEFVSVLYDLPQQNSDSDPQITSHAVVVMDMDSKVVLYQKNPDTMVLPASTTKIISALVTLENYLPSDILTVPNSKFQGSDMGLVAGETITVEALLRGLLIVSANDAAETLAVNFPGGRHEFIKQMNEAAARLNLSNTYFTNPSGFDDFNHRSTARDMVRAADAAMKYPLFADIVKLKRDIVSSNDGQIVHRLESTNELLGQVEGVYGVKTGWTEDAQENLVTFYSKDGRNIMMALLGSQDRFGDTKRLIDWINNNYSWVSVES